MKDKLRILSALNQALPEDATIAEAIDYLLYMQGIEEGMDDARNGRLIAHEEIVRMIRSWDAGSR